eukprot:1429891-Lingulodinium_polyedra.AAC.1
MYARACAWSPPRPACPNMHVASFQGLETFLSIASTKTRPPGLSRALAESDASSPATTASNAECKRFKRATW